MGFPIPVSGTARKCLRISRLVSCHGFRISISRVSFQRPFTSISGFRGLFRVSCLGFRFRLKFCVRGLCFGLYWSFSGGRSSVSYGFEACSVSRIQVWGFNSPVSVPLESILGFPCLFRVRGSGCWVSLVWFWAPPENILRFLGMFVLMGLSLRFPRFGFGGHSRVF